MPTTETPTSSSTTSSGRAGRRALFALALAFICGMLVLAPRHLGATAILPSPTAHRATTTAPSNTPPLLTTTSAPSSLNDRSPPSTKSSPETTKDTLLPGRDGASLAAQPSVPPPTTSATAPPPPTTNKTPNATTALPPVIVSLPSPATPTTKPPSSHHPNSTTTTGITTSQFDRGISDVFAINHLIMRREMPFSSYSLEERDASAIMVTTGEYHDAVLSYLLGAATLPVNLGIPHRPPPHRHRRPWALPKRAHPPPPPFNNDTMLVPSAGAQRGFAAQDSPSSLTSKRALPPQKATSFFGAYWYWPTRPTAPLPSIIGTNTKWLNALDRPSTTAMAKNPPSMSQGPPSAYSALPRTRGMLLSSPQFCIHAPTGGGKSQTASNPRQVLLVSLPLSNNTSSELDGLYSQMHINASREASQPLREELVGLTAHRSCEWRHIAFNPPFPYLGTLSSTPSLPSPPDAAPQIRDNLVNDLPAVRGGVPDASPTGSSQRHPFTPQADSSSLPRFATSKLISPLSRRRDMSPTNMCEKGVLSARLPTDPFMLPTTTNPQPIWLNYHVLALENVLTMPLGGQPSLITGLGAAAAIKEGYVISPDGRRLSRPQPPPQSDGPRQGDEEMEELRDVDNQWLPAGIDGKDGLHKFEKPHPLHQHMGDDGGLLGAAAERTFTEKAVNRERTSVVNIGVGSSVCSNTMRELILNTKSARTRALLLYGFGETRVISPPTPSTNTADVDSTLWHLFPRWNRRRLEMISPVLRRLRSDKKSVPSSNTTTIFCRNCLVDIQNTTWFHDNGSRTLHASLSASHWVRSHTLSIVQVGDPPATDNTITSATPPRREANNTSTLYMSVLDRVRALPFNITYAFASPSEMLPAYLDPYYLYDENADADERFRFSSGIARLTATTLGAKYFDAVGTSTQQLSTRIGALHLSADAASSDRTIEDRFASIVSNSEADDAVYNDTTLGCPAMRGSPQGRTEPNLPAHGSLHRPPVFAAMVVSKADYPSPHFPPPHFPPHHPPHGDIGPPPFQGRFPRPPSPPDTLHIPHVVSPAQCSKRTSVLYVGSSHARFPFLFHCSMLGYTWCTKIEKASHYFGVRGYRDPGEELRDPLSRMSSPSDGNVSLRDELLSGWGSSVSQGVGSARHEEAHRADTAPYDQLGRYEGRMAYHPNTTFSKTAPITVDKGLVSETASSPPLPYRFRPDSISIAYLSQGVFANYAPHLRRFLKQLTQRTSDVSEYRAYSSPQSQPDYTPYPSLNLSAPLTPSELQYASTFFTHIVFAPSVWEMNYVDMTAYDHSRDISEGVLALHALFPRAKIVVINEHYHHTPVLHPGQQRVRFAGTVCRTPSVVAKYRDGVLCGISNHSMSEYQRETAARDGKRAVVRRGSFVDVSNTPIPPSHQVELLDVFPQTRESPVAFFTDNHGHHYVDVAGEGLAMRLLRDHVCPPSTVYIRKLLPPNPSSPSTPKFVMRPVSALLYGVVVSKRLPTLLRLDAQNGSTTNPTNDASKGDAAGLVMSADGVLSRPLPSLSEVTSSPLATFRETRIMHVDTISSLHNTTTPSGVWEGVACGGVQRLFPLSKKPMEEDSKELCHILQEEYTATSSQQDRATKDGYPPAPSFIPDPLCSCLRPSTLAWFPKQCREQFPHVMEYDESRLYHG